MDRKIPRGDMEFKDRKKARSSQTKEFRSFQKDGFKKAGDDKHGLVSPCSHRVTFSSDLITAVQTRPRTLTSEKAALYWTKDDMRRFLTKNQRVKHGSSSSLLSDDESSVRDEFSLSLDEMCRNRVELNFSPASVYHQQAKKFNEQEYAHNTMPFNENQECTEEEGPHLLGSMYDFDTTTDSSVLYHGYDFDTQ